jgi:hypothetical protein
VRHANLHTVALALAAALAISLAACGGDDGTIQTTAPAVTGAAEATTGQNAPGTEAPEDEPAADPASDREKISRTLEVVLTGSGPSEACGDLVTERYLRSYGGPAGCENAQGGASAAERVHVSRIVILPDSVAQAAVTPKGGVYDGERLRAELVLDNGTWMLDSLRSNVPVGP